MADDLAQWLEELDLGKYVAVFAENEVGLRDLPHLSEADLKELGLPLGPRRRLLAAISAQEPSEAHGEASTTAPPPQGRVQGAERRHLTVMFCDLVGSTALSRQLDPEEFRDLMRRYQDVVAGTITRYGGHVAKYLGDGVLAYFGWPQAYEDQATRAIHAGLDAVAGVAGIRHGGAAASAARVGIASGQVVVGDLVGEFASESDAVSGETPNLAARFQTLADPGQVLIGADTRRLIGTNFELADLGPRPIKGYDDTVRAWQVIGLGQKDSRFEALHAGGVGPILGRDHELGQLGERWDLAASGHGQVVVLSGEAGLGKSRLIRALSERISDQSHFRLSYQCSPHHTSTTLYPIVQRLARVAGFGDDDSNDLKLDKLEELLAMADDDVATAAPLIAHLLSVPFAHRYGALDLEPPQMRTRTIAALVNQVRGLARRRPVLLVLEDAHWIDPTTEELMGEMIAAIEDAAVLILVSHRPEYVPPWTGFAHLMALVLNRLAKTQAETIVRELAGAALSEATVASIVAKSGGVPLFLEELTKSVLETGGATEAGQTTAVPDTLQASLLARLDHLGDAKELAQIGAVIGRQFSHQLITHLCDRPTAEVDALLDTLVKSELAFQRGVPPEATYTFKHALIQDAAYDSLLISRRKALHEAIVATIEALGDDQIEEQVETLAYHAERAELWEKALRYARLAGLRANENSAYREALRFMDAGLAAADQLPEVPGIVEQVIDIHMNMRPSLGSLGLYDRLLQSLSEANRLAHASGDDATATFADVVKTHVLYQTGHIDEVLKLGARTVRLARDFADKRIVIAATANLAMGYCFHGDFARAVEVASEFTDDLTGTYRHANLGTTGTSSVNWLSNLSGMLTNLGEFDRALHFSTIALEISEETGKPFDAAMVAQWRAHLELTIGRPEVAIEVLEASQQALHEYSLDFLRTWMSSWLGAAYALVGDHQRAEQTLRSAVDLGDRTGLRLSQMWSLVRLASLYLDMRDKEKAAAYASEAHERAEKAGTDWLRLPALQCLARVAGDDARRAVRLWREAIELAERTGARPELAHARFGLGRQLRQIGDGDDAEVELSAAAALYRDLGMDFWLPRTEAALAAGNAD